MRRSVARLKGLAFIIWHARHEFYHILLGLLWAWFLRERWNEFNQRWIWIALFGSLLPDIDHFYYFFTYGRSESYTRTIRTFLQKKQWRALTVFIEHGHKYQTNLSSHNYYFMAGLIGLSLLSSFIDWQVGVILFGAMVIHYLFDIADDLIILGTINPSWKRWGRGKSSISYKGGVPRSRYGGE